MKILLTFFILSTSYTFYGQTKIDNWFKIENETVKGYFNYSVEEDSLSINTIFDFKLKIDSTLLNLNVRMSNEKDVFLTVKSFDIVRTEDNLSNPEELKISGTVNSYENYSKWKVNGDTSEIETKHPTIVDLNLFHALTTLNYAEKGRILEFNSMEISELNYKENHYLEYIADETLFIDNKEVRTRKITHKGDGIGGSTYWLDFNNNLIKIAIDNRDTKSYVKCKKNDINFEDYD